MEIPPSEATEAYVLELCALNYEREKMIREVVADGIQSTARGHLW